MEKYVLGHISLIWGFLGGLFEFWGVIFGFAKNVKALLGPVVNLGRGQNCDKK